MSFLKARRAIRLRIYTCCKGRNDPIGVACRRAPPSGEARRKPAGRNGSRTIELTPRASLAAPSPQPDAPMRFRTLIVHAPWCSSWQPNRDDVDGVGAALHGA